MNGEITIRCINPEDALALTERSYRQVFATYLRADRNTRPLLKKRLDKLSGLYHRLAIKKLNDHYENSLYILLSYFARNKASYLQGKIFRRS